MEILRDFLAGGHDVAHVRIFGLAQRRGHADVDGVEIADGGKIGGGAKFAVRHERLDGRRRNVADIGIARVDSLGFAFAQIDARNVEAGLGVFDGQRQPDIAQSDDANTGGLRMRIFSASIRPSEVESQR